MKRKITKVGNSLGLTIPKVYITKLGLNEGSAIEIEERDGTLIIAPIIKKAVLMKESELLEELNVYELITYPSGKEWGEME